MILTSAARKFSVVLLRILTCNVITCHNCSTVTITIKLRKNTKNRCRSCAQCMILINIGLYFTLFFFWLYQCYITTYLLKLVYKGNYCRPSWVLIVKCSMTQTCYDLSIRQFVTDLVWSLVLLMWDTEIFLRHFDLSQTNKYSLNYFKIKLMAFFFYEFEVSKLC